MNALLQGEYFSAVDLAEIAQQLDESEREQMAVNGLQTEEYRKFMQVGIKCTLFIIHKPFQTNYTMMPVKTELLD